MSTIYIIVSAGMIITTRNASTKSGRKVVIVLID